VIKQLRETVKRMSADLKMGLVTVEDRLSSLNRVVERLVDEEDEFIIKDVAAFLQQADNSLLTSDRPSRSELPASVLSAAAGQGQGNYMLNRYLIQTGSSQDLHKQDSFVSVKSMQHFLLQLSTIEAALQGWKSRLAATATAGLVDKNGLASALTSMEVVFTAAELEAIFYAGFDAPKFDEDEEEDGGKAEEKQGEEKQGTIDDLLRSTAVWDLIRVRMRSRAVFTMVAFTDVCWWGSWHRGSARRRVGTSC
jgi:hypothetical protein